MKRVVWIWLAEEASDLERKYWQRFIKINMSVSSDVRFIIAADSLDLERKLSILQNAGWRCERQGEGLMARITYLVKGDYPE